MRLTASFHWSPRLAAHQHRQKRGRGGNADCDTHAQWLQQALMPSAIAELYPLRATVPRTDYHTAGKLIVPTLFSWVECYPNQSEKKREG